MICPICGKKIKLIGKTTDNRVIGSCKDAFYYKGKGIKKNSKPSFDSTMRNMFG